MKRIMIVGAGILQEPIIKSALAAGYETVVVSPDVDEVGHKISTYSAIANVRDEEEVLKYARKFNIDGIITDQTDIAVRTVAYVAEKMDLSGIGYDTARLFTDKFLMREKCKQLGIKTLKYKLVGDIDTALDFLNELGGKAILKPIDNQGSRGVSLIDSPEKMRIKFEEAMRYSAQKRVLVEQVAEGREFVVEGLALNYKFRNLIVGDTHYFNIPDTYSATKRVFPSQADDNLVSRVKELNQKIITGFGLKQGITHSEFIMNDDDIILIETAARGGGVFISSDLINLSTGLDTNEFLINMALGKKMDYPNFEKNKGACCYLAFYLPVGEVVSTSGIEEVLKLPYVYRSNLNSIKPGMITKEYTDKTARFFLIISADNITELTDRQQIVRDYLDNIKIKTDRGEETPIWE